MRTPHLRLPQIFDGAFHALRAMAATFALRAATMSLGSLLSSRIVERLGMRAAARTALLSFIALTASHTIICLVGRETPVLFTLLQAPTMACLSIACANLGAVAMQPMARIAGSAASIQGFISMVGGSGVGALIANQWSGTPTFLPLGSLVCGMVALALAAAAKRARSPHPQER